MEPELTLQLQKLVIFFERIGVKTHLTDYQTNTEAIPVMIKQQGKTWSD